MNDKEKSETRSKLEKKSSSNTESKNELQEESNNIIQSLGEIDFYLANFVNQASAYWQRPIMCNVANSLFEKNAYL